jgi:hypothetical protein
MPTSTMDERERGIFETCGCLERPAPGSVELRAWQDDDRLGVQVRLLLNAYERDDRSSMRHSGDALARGRGRMSAISRTRRHPLLIPGFGTPAF